MAEKANTLNIYQRLSKITAELGVVAKNLRIQQNKNSGYNAVSERDVLDAVKPLEAKYGVYSYPARRKILESHILENESEYQGKVTKRTTFMTRIETVYRFINIDNPEEFTETTVFSEGIDPQDKGSGKAMTYADKYALMKAYKISTGEDPDAEPSGEPSYKDLKQKDEPEPAKEPEKPPIICPNCGKEVKPVKKKDGTEKTAEEVLAGCGGVCLSCYRAALKEMKAKEKAEAEPMPTDFEEVKTDDQ